MHFWAATQYLYHDNERQFKDRVHYGHNGSRVFWYKVKGHLMSLPIVSSVPHLSCHDLTTLKILLVIADYVIQTLVHFQISNTMSCTTSPWFNAVSTCAAGNSIILEQISWVAGWLHHVILTMLCLNHNFMKLLCSNNKSQMSHIAIMTSLLRLTNCFFLSVDSLFISSLSAFISSSLYWKSRTINLHLEVNKIKSAILHSTRDRMHTK